jgi:hypothetical protein
MRAIVIGHVNLAFDVEHGKRVMACQRHVQRLTGLEVTNQA